MVARVRKPYVYPGLAVRPARMSKCHRCSRKVLRATKDGWSLVLDPDGLTLEGEVEAMLQGQRTFHLVGDHLYRRHAMAIDELPEPNHGKIIRVHKCDQPTSLHVREIERVSDDPGF